MTSDRILFAEWADDTLSSSRLLGAQGRGSPCPICQNPTGNCTHIPAEGAIMATSTAKTTTEKAAAEQAEDVKNVVESDGPAGNPDNEAVVVGLEAESLTESLYDVTAGDTMVTLKQDVIEEFRYPNTKRPAYRVLYTAGQTVALSAIQAYQAAAEAAKAPAPTGDAAVAAYVDSTTLASGTHPGIGALESQPGSGSK